MMMPHCKIQTKLKALVTAKKTKTRPQIIPATPLEIKTRRPVHIIALIGPGDLGAPSWFSAGKCCVRTPPTMGARLSNSLCRTGT